MLITSADMSDLLLRTEQVTLLMGVYECDAVETEPFNRKTILSGDVFFPIE